MTAPVQYGVAIAGTLALAALVHWRLGPYPQALDTTDRRRELIEVGVLVAGYFSLTGYAALAYRGRAPAPDFFVLNGRVINPAVVLGGVVIAVVGPIALEVGVRDRSLAELGVRWPRRWLPAIVLFGVGFGQGVSGVVAGGTAVSPLALVVALYNPAFEEELFFHGVVQSKLERATTPVRAWLVSGVLFGLAHAPNDFLGSVWLASGGELLAAVLLLARQTAFGLFVGVCYAKSRSLLAPVAAHYLTNDIANVVATVVETLP